jgi:hypothetical protein
MVRVTAKGVGVIQLIECCSCMVGQIDEGYLSAPEAVEFPTEGGLTAHMNYYAPRNKVRVHVLGTLQGVSGQ